MILTVRTDKPEAEIGLFSEEGEQLRYHQWQADRQLAKTLLATIRDELNAADADWEKLTGIVVFEGPGSFTGLRIGITVANTLSYSLNIPIVASQGDRWIQNGLNRLKNEENDRIALPHYGADAHITQPRK
ncbi:MAG: tRNA (adenosine(37)-N6)-threonylcarbamoyltransferase complex dimerization subunit type 1 TsaB [Candidatus Saccharimonadales bacterium]